MNIGDKVRFLNDVGGGKITAFRKGGIVLVEDEDGFDIPVNENEIVVVETNRLNIKQEKTAPKVEFGAKSIKENEERLDGKEYLKSKSVPAKEEEEVDEQMEARIARLEMTIGKLEATIGQLTLRLERMEKEKIARDNVMKMQKEKNKTVQSVNVAPSENLKIQTQIL